MSIFDALDQLKARCSSVATAAEESAERVEAASVRINDALNANSDRTRRAIGDLRSYLAELDSGWAIELEKQLELVEIGGKRIDEVIAKFGDWLITTETGTMRIRELLQTIDPGEFEERVRQLERAARDGGDALASAIDLLRQKGGQLTASLLTAIDAFQRGEGSLDRILRIIEQIKTVTGGQTTLDDLLETIARELDEGARDGSFD